ncbi:TauD/TfdA family dioxygenase [Xenorhabdus bovienii]|uniref:Tou3 n=1 Tax=Xenorhabdus bovienii str. kraussei Becker Underwood TaxID=1398204 RepID=A0A077PJF0_XENBV|nr:TauD/TfdA family dioxygenase [Xenorhabdus bovienii]CDH24560.1 Tou3 [Xenorhabdus bovienii str. kraussei Becker Underwood]
MNKKNLELKEQECSVIPQSVLKFLDVHSSSIESLENWYYQYQNIIYSMWPEIKKFPANIENKVKKDGYTVVKNLGINNLTKETRELALFILLSSLGKLTTHSVNDYFWDIKHRGNMKEKDNLTFSERYGECPLHSDSAFSKYPEKYLTMYVIKPAADGGDSIFVSIKDLTKEMINTPDGSKCLSILFNEIFPFETPSSFDNSSPTFLGPILEGDNKIRFRYDCIIKGFKKYPDVKTTEKVWAVEFFNNYLQYKASKKIFPGEMDQLIIIDNHHGLHARTDFQDKYRHLLRARVI